MAKRIIFKDNSTVGGKKISSGNMTEAKHVFTIEIMSEVIEPFTYGKCFFLTLKMTNV